MWQENLKYRKGFNILTVNYFCKTTSSWMSDRVLKLPKPLKLSVRSQRHPADALNIFLTH